MSVRFHIQEVHCSEATNHDKSPNITFYLRFVSGTGWIIASGKYLFFYFFWLYDCTIWKKYINEKVLIFWGITQKNKSRSQWFWDSAYRNKRDVPIKIFWLTIQSDFCVVVLPIPIPVPFFVHTLITNMNLWNKGQNSYWKRWNTITKGLIAILNEHIEHYQRHCVVFVFILLWTNQEANKNIPFELNQLDHVIKYILIWWYCAEVITAVFTY